MTFWSALLLFRWVNFNLLFGLPIFKMIFRLGFFDLLFPPPFFDLLSRWGSTIELSDNKRINVKIVKTFGKYLNIVICVYFY